LSNNTWIRYVLTLQWVDPRWSDSWWIVQDPLFLHTVGEKKRLGTRSESSLKSGTHRMFPHFMICANCDKMTNKALYKRQDLIKFCPLVYIFVFQAKIIVQHNEIIIICIFFCWLMIIYFYISTCNSYFWYSFWVIQFNDHMY
jgi:hypothetical protein